MFVCCCIPSRPGRTDACARVVFAVCLLPRAVFAHVRATILLAFFCGSLVHTVQPQKDREQLLPTDKQTTPGHGRYRDRPASGDLICHSYKTHV